MKIVIEIPDDKLPLPFKLFADGIDRENLWHFLNTQMKCLPLEKKCHVLAEDSQHKDLLLKHADWEIELGELIMAGLRIER